jgi:hypothetical protein
MIRTTVGFAPEVIKRNVPRIGVVKILAAIYTAERIPQVDCETPFGGYPGTAVVVFACHVLIVP